MMMKKQQFCHMNPINNEIIFHVAIACRETAEKVVLMDRRLEFEI
jgi:hypothetical protein